MDQKKFLSLKASLLDKLEDIRAQQGFTKNREDIQLCIKNIDTGHIPGGKVKGNVKATRKLHYSLQLYLWRSGFCHRPIRSKFENLFHEYSLFEGDRRLLNTPVDVSSIISVNVPDNCVTATYKAKRIKTFDHDREDGDAISSRFRSKANSAVASRPGVKRVNKNMDFHVKLRKKYETEEELDQDLYRIYVCWYQSKLKSHQHHVSLHNKFTNVLMNYTQLRENKAHRRYFVSQSLMKEYVKLRRGDHKKIPKRFMKITKLLSHIKEGKWIRNDSVVESFVTKASVACKKEDSGVYRRIEDCCLYTANKQVFKWLSLIFWDLWKRGYLTDTDVPKTRKPTRGPKYLCDPVTNYDHSGMWHDSSLMLPFKKKKDKFYLGLKKILLADIHETYVRLNYDELDFFDYINSETKKIKKVVSSDEFKEFVRRFHQPRVGLPVLKTEFLRLLGKDDKIMDFLDSEEKEVLSRAALINPYVDYALESCPMSKSVEYQARLMARTSVISFRSHTSRLAEQLLDFRAMKHKVVSKLKNIKIKSKRVFSKEEWDKVVRSVVEKDKPDGLYTEIALAEIEDLLNF